MTTTIILFFLLVAYCAIKDLAVEFGWFLPPAPTHCKHCGGKLKSVKYDTYALGSPYCDSLRRVFKCKCSKCDDEYMEFID